jgi:hypothetical protein
LGEGLGVRAKSIFILDFSSALFPLLGQQLYNKFEHKAIIISMQTTPEQTRAIIRWGHQHRRMLRDKYRCQFVAYSATRLLAASSDWDLVEALAEAEQEPYLVKWIPAQTSEFQFF